MNREKQLVKNTAIITIGKVCTQTVSFFLLPLYTAVLTTEEYGVVDLLNTIISLLLPIVTFQIEQALFRKLVDCRNDENNVKNVISTTLVTTLVQSIVYLVLFFIISPLIKNDYKYFLAINLIASMYSSIFLQIARGLGDNKTYAIGSFITASSTVFMNIIFIILFKWGAYGMLMASMLGNVLCIVYIFYIKKIYKYIELKRYNKNLLKQLLKYSIPLIPNAISWWIFNSSDRIIVSSILGIGQNGILSAAYKFSNVYITIYNIFSITWTESAALHIKDKDSDEFFSNVINVSLKLFTAVCMVIIAFMPFVFPIMINEKFGDAYYQIPILMISSLFNVIVGLLSVIYIAKKDTKAVARTSIIAAIINLIVNLGTIKFIGLYAASVSTLAAYLIMAIYRYFDVKKYIRIKTDKKFIMISIFIIFITLIAYYINNLYINIINIVIVLIYSILINEKVIFAFYNGYKSRKAKNKNKMY